MIKRNKENKYSQRNNLNQINQVRIHQEIRLILMNPVKNSKIHLDLIIHQLISIMNLIKLNKDKQKPILI